MSGPVVAITRPYDRAIDACDIVRRLGGECVLAPTLDLEPVNTKSLKKLVDREDDMDWIVFTSPTTIISLNEFYPNFIKNISCKVAVIGNKTAQVARDHGICVDLVPEKYTAEGLVEEFEKLDVSGQVIGVPRTLSARPTLIEGLERLGNEVILAEAYRSVFPMDRVKVEYLISQIKEKKIDAITFTSPLTVENFFNIVVQKDMIADILSNDLITVAIGPITGRSLEKYNVSFIYPDIYNVQNMMELLFEVWGRKR